MRKLTVLSLLLLLLAACQNKGNTQDAQQSIDSPSQSVTEKETQQNEEISTSQEKEDIHQSISMKQTIPGTNWRLSNL
ncbi:hypothetical protein [Paenibacillus amylolyticus]|uniref:hypothetical protein n=1 Tax=Paenibacillus amylolyticus TaxID=1451 RepID=UPI000B83FFB6|nr:hypothetical protein [Paenibacillus amylolyticus]